MKLWKNIGFDSVGSTVIVHNSENAHICLEEEILFYKIKPILSNGMAIIRGKDIITKEIGTVSWSWTGDEG